MGLTVFDRETARELANSGVLDEKDASDIDEDDDSLEEEEESEEMTDVEERSEDEEMAKKPLRGHRHEDKEAKKVKRRWFDFEGSQS
jgi:hypothetical protein